MNQGAINFCIWCVIVIVSVLSSVTTLTKSFINTYDHKMVSGKEIYTPTKYEQSGPVGIYQKGKPPAYPIAVHTRQAVSMPNKLSTDEIFSILGVAASGLLYIQQLSIALHTPSLIPFLLIPYAFKLLFVIVASFLDLDLDMPAVNMIG